LDAFALRETRYPLELESSFESSDSRLKDVEPIMVRAMQMCSHETYYGLPVLRAVAVHRRHATGSSHHLHHDARRPFAAQSVLMFDASRVLNGLTQSRYPSRVLQMIPPFSLWYVAMLHDFAMWKGRPRFPASTRSGARGILDHFPQFAHTRRLDRRA
jgi:hypothetical protein